MENMGTYLGYAMLPFMLSLIFAITNIGTKKISWFLDVLSFAVAFFTYFVLERFLITDIVINQFGNYFFLHMAGAMVNYICVLVALKFYYGAIYGKGDAAVGHAAA